MNEVFINIMAILVIYVITNFIRSKYKDKVSLNVIRGIYLFAIAYFIVITIYF